METLNVTEFINLLLAWMVCKLYIIKNIFVKCFDFFFFRCTWVPITWFCLSSHKESTWSKLVKKNFLVVLKTRHIAEQHWFYHHHCCCVTRGWHQPKSFLDLSHCILHFTCSSNVNATESVKYGRDMERWRHTTLKTDVVSWDVFSAPQWFTSYITETSTIYLDIYWGTSIQGGGDSRSEHWHRYPGNDS